MERGKITILDPSQSKTIKIMSSNDNTQGTQQAIKITNVSTSGTSQTGAPAERRGIQILDEVEKFEKGLTEKQKAAFKNISTRRLVEEEKNVVLAFERGIFKKDEIESFQPLMKNGAKDLYEWELIVKGKAGTLWEGGKYKIYFHIPIHFPTAPPKVIFKAPPNAERFQHVHVYNDGKLCLDLIDPKNYRADVGFVAIVEAVYNTIHNKPNPQSPANLSMNSLFMEKVHEYEKIIREQALNCSKW